jgi:hypothetical protein
MSDLFQLISDLRDKYIQHGPHQHAVFYCAETLVFTRSLTNEDKLSFEEIMLDFAAAMIEPDEQDIEEEINEAGWFKDVDTRQVFSDLLELHPFFTESNHQSTPVFQWNFDLLPEQSDKFAVCTHVVEIMIELRKAFKKVNFPEK